MIVVTFTSEPNKSFLEKLLPRITKAPNVTKHRVTDIFCWGFSYVTSLDQKPHKCLKFHPTYVMVDEYIESKHTVVKIHVT